MNITRIIRNAIRYSQQFAGQLFVIGIDPSLKNWNEMELAHDINMIRQDNIRFFLFCNPRIAKEYTDYFQSQLANSLNTVPQVVILPYNGIKPDITAADFAIKIHADKLIYVTQSGGIYKRKVLVTQMSISQAQNFLTEEEISGDMKDRLLAAIHACENGVKRAHIISERHNRGDSLVKELFSAEGVGTLITSNPYIEIRPATTDDLIDIAKLIANSSFCNGIDLAESLTDGMKNWVYTLDGEIYGCAIIDARKRSYEIKLLIAEEDNYVFETSMALMRHIIQEAQQNEIKNIFFDYKQTPIWLLLATDFHNLGFIPNGKPHRLIKHITLG